MDASLSKAALVDRLDREIARGFEKEPDTAEVERTAPVTGT